MPTFEELQADIEALTHHRDELDRKRDLLLNELHKLKQTLSIRVSILSVWRIAIKIHLRNAKHSLAEAITHKALDAMGTTLPFTVLFDLLESKSVTKLAELNNETLLTELAARVAAFRTSFTHIISYLLDFFKFINSINPTPPELGTLSAVQIVLATNNFGEGSIIEKLIAKVEERLAAIELEITEINVQITNREHDLSDLRTVNQLVSDVVSSFFSTDADEPPTSTVGDSTRQVSTSVTLS